MGHPRGPTINGVAGLRRAKEADMLRKGILAGACVLVAIFGPAVLRGQQPAAKPPISPEAHEFPIVLRQNVVAGITSVGTKVQAKLVIATLVDGGGIPRDAVW